MSNQTYTKGLYNLEQKEMYLKNLGTNTRATYYRILNRAKPLEEQFEKDLYNFNIHEIESLMNYLNPKTFNSSFSSISVIQSYIRWAIEQDLRIDNLNPLDAIFGDEFVRKFIDTNNKMIFSEEEIRNIVGGLVNYQDSVIIQCLFEGIMGKKYSEILNLKISDVNFVKNEIKLINDISETEVSERIIQLDEGSNLPKMLELATNELIYYKNNGSVDPKAKSDRNSLVDNGFVLKVVLMNTKIEANKPADQHLILRRLKKVAEWFNEPHLNAINIRNSGMLKMARDLYWSEGELGSNQIERICEKFNVTHRKNGVFNATRFKKEFLNIDKIKEIYGEKE